LAQVGTRVATVGASANPHCAPAFVLMAMKTFARSAALAQLTILLLSGHGVCGGFLGVKLPAVPKFNPSHLDPSKVKIPKVDLSPTKLTRPAVEKVKAVEKTITGESPAQVSDLVQQHEAAAKAKVADLPGQASDLLKQGAEATSEAKLGAVETELKKAAGQVNKVVDTMKQERPSGGLASAVRSGSSHLAVAVNQSSVQFAEFLRSYGPRASAVLTHSGEALACKFSGDCHPTRPDVEEEVLPLDPEDLESWAFWGFTLFLLAAVCGVSFGAVKCAWAAGRKGSILLSDAMVPLTEPSAREPTMVQMRAPAAGGATHEGLLG